MTSAELKTLRESLGLPVRWLAEQAGVTERMIRHWESGRNVVPDYVAELIERIEAQSIAMIDAALDQVDRVTREQGSAPAGVDLVRYETDDELWRSHPDCQPLPATWHAAVLARVARKLEARGVRAVIECA